MNTNKFRLLIVQPWFTAKGHPAQSLLNTASVLGKNDQVSYLISRQLGDNTFVKFEKKLHDYGHVMNFIVPSSSIRVGTVLGLIALLRRKNEFDNIFFLDAHLVLLALVWPWINGVLKVKKISVIYLMGPEKVSRHWLIKRFISSFISRSDTQIFLRTEELADAWKRTFPGKTFDVLPSLELSEAIALPEPPVPVEIVRYGVIGQVRPGKGIEWLVPLFENHPEIGKLTVAGTFFSRQHEHSLAVLKQSSNFINRFMSEEELVMVAANQHYLLMLYDYWDDRMEAATLYLAAKANRPVIVRDNGWSGRMVRRYNCGLFLRKNDEPLDFFLSLPKPGDVCYLNLLSGLERFRRDHSGEEWRAQFLKKLI